MARVRPAQHRVALTSPIAEVVAKGLGRRHKTLPPFLFYDEEGSRLYERITELPEYYPTRTERAIFEQQADAIVAAAAEGSEDLLTVIELGAGTATKTQLLLEAIARRQGRTRFVPIDVSRTALDEAARRIRAEAPLVEATPLCRLNHEALPYVANLPPRQFVLFVGSSIGNYDDLEAQALLRGLRRALRPGAVFLLGTDLRKSPDVLLPAYDDAQGVTAAFNKNVLARINRELGGRFDVDSFRHVAVWNDAGSRIEMHLESLVEQEVAIDDLGLRVRFARGERIHTESSVKYDSARVDTLFRVSGFRRFRTFTDECGWFGVHLATTA